MNNIQNVFNFTLPAAMSGQDFIVCEANKQAVEWLGNASNWPAPILFIYGAPSCGKSHLCQIFHDIYQARTVSEKDLSDNAFLQSLKPEGFYVVDDVDRIIQNNPAIQDMLFHFYNFLFQDGGRLLLTGRTPPKDIDFTLPDLRSRFLAAPAVEILPPDDTALQTLLIKLFDDRQITIRPDVVKFLHPRLERSYHAVHKAVQDLDRLSLQGKRPITIPLVRQWFENQ